MRKKKEQVIRIGDRIKVINPEIFMRCGYPLTIQDGIKMLSPEEIKCINQLVG